MLAIFPSAACSTGVWRSDRQHRATGLANHVIGDPAEQCHDHRTLSFTVDPAASKAYRGTQGDVWDAEKTMVAALLAAGIEWRRQVRSHSGRETSLAAIATRLKE